MSRPSDEILMAYADDALDPVERIRVETHLRDDAEARELVEMFRQTRFLAASAFKLDQPDPRSQALAEMILAHPNVRSGGPGATSASTGNIADLDAERARRSQQRRATALPMAVAASIALVLGLGTGWLLGPTGSRQPEADVIALGPVAPQSVLGGALEQVPSGSNRGDIALVATFRDRANRICREFEIVGAGAAPTAAAQSAAIACRDGTGGWVIEGAALLAQGGPGTPSSGDFVPSGADEKDALASLLTMIGAKPVMTAAEEQALLARGWK